MASFVENEMNVPTCISIFRQMHLHPTLLFTDSFYLLSVGLQVRCLGCQNFCNLHARQSLQQQNNVQTTLASLLTRLTDKRLFVFGAGRYNRVGVPCFLRHSGVYHV